MLSCPFCAADPDDAWGFTDQAIALPAPEPLAPGHCMVAPRRHVGELVDLDVSERQAIWSLSAMIHERIRARMSVKAFHIGFAEFPGGVAHMHVHFVPKALGGRIRLPSGIVWLKYLTDGREPMALRGGQTSLRVDQGG